MDHISLVTAAAKNRPELTGFKHFEVGQEIYDFCVGLEELDHERAEFEFDEGMGLADGPDWPMPPNFYRLPAPEMSMALPFGDEIAVVILREKDDHVDVSALPPGEYPRSEPYPPLGKLFPGNYPEMSGKV